ncbi:MAG: hypothetical protein K6U14_05970 [Firmicutes bacterium]|nr:hypothetical protein [Alicyclobacillaceae bacterium]MCL6497167.1 hypothetical protein [Bacillota bacterium]
MARGLWLASVAALGLAAALFVLGFHRVTRVVVLGPRWAWRIPFGDAPTAVREAVGMDGAQWGPLAFRVHRRHLYLLDSYGWRLTEWDPAGRLVRTLPLEHIFGQDVAVSPGQTVVVFDGRTGTVWRLGGSTPEAVVRLPQGRGVTAVAERLAWAGNDLLLVQWLAVGKNQLTSHLDGFGLTGQAEQQSLHEVRLNAVQAAKAPLAGFAVGPDQRLVLGFATAADRWQVDVMAGDAVVASRTIALPKGTQSAVLLGVDQRERLYFGLNLGRRGPGAVAVYSSAGQLVAHWTVPPEPVATRVWGEVKPSGEVYVVENSASAYRIARWRVTTRRVWEWF